MLELFIIRHGDAGKNYADEALDNARSLSQKGQDEMKAVAKHLKELKVHIDLIFSSPLNRAKETADIIQKYCGETKEVEVTDLLIPGSAYEDLIHQLNENQDLKSIAIVGHQPFLSGFASYCLTKNMMPIINLKKGGILKLDIDETLKPGNCVLMWLMEPSQCVRN